MRFYSVVMSCAVALCAPMAAAAQNLPAPNLALAKDERVLYGVVLDDLRALAASQGATITSEKNEGDVSLIAKNNSGLIFNLVGKVCELDGRIGCLGLSMEVRYDDDASVTLDKINEANRTYAAAKTTWYPEKKTFIVNRYMILDGGESMANLKVNLMNTLDLGIGVSEVIWPKK
jgi:Putative bacterial sensory transduction regulator